MSSEAEAKTPGAVEEMHGRPSIALGFSAALLAVTFTSVYPAATRVSVTTTLAPADLLMLRLGVSGLLFAPYLLWKARSIPPATWRAGVKLSFFHGWGMAGCVIFGLKFAPASHSAALGPGTISIWIAVANFLLYGIAVSRERLWSIALIVSGAILLLAASFGGLSTANALAGDALFIAASVLGALYLTYVQRHQVNPVLGAALVSTYSAIILLPWYLFFARSTIANATATEIVWQVIVQGFLMGCAVFLAINFAVITVGSQTVGMLFALVPVLGTLSSLAITNDPVLHSEWVAIAAISVGVFFGARPKLR